MEATLLLQSKGGFEEVKDWLGTTKSLWMRQDVLPLSQIHMEKPWDMNGEAWARERQFFIQMEKKTVYEYNEAMRLTAMKIFSGEMREKTIRYSYDEAGRLIGKQMPGRNYTDYRYNAVGKLEEILHKGADKSAVAVKQMQTERKIMRMTTEEICYP